MFNNQRLMINSSHFYNKIRQETCLIIVLILSLRHQTNEIDEKVKALWGY